jgi:hypothetical protein
MESRCLPKKALSSHSLNPCTPQDQEIFSATTKACPWFGVINPFVSHTKGGSKYFEVENLRTSIIFGLADPLPTDFAFSFGESIT